MTEVTEPYALAIKGSQAEKDLISKGWLKTDERGDWVYYEPALHKTFDPNKPVEVHSFVFNPESNGGESLILTTKVYHHDASGKEVWTEQSLSLQSYCNAASLQLSGAQLTPDKLRKLANELDELMARNKNA